MPSARPKSTRRELPWWATAGSERCPVCLLSYHLESEVRCAACDAPLCPDCATTLLTVELVCVDCSRDGGER